MLSRAESDYLSEFGRLLQGTVNLLLAMNGEPEPRPQETVDELVGKLRELAARLREEP